MSLIGRFIDQLLPVGSITIVQPDGKRETHGGGGGKNAVPIASRVVRDWLKMREVQRSHPVREREGAEPEEGS